MIQPMKRSIDADELDPWRGAGVATGEGPGGAAALKDGPIIGGCAGLTAGLLRGVGIEDPTPLEPIGAATAPDITDRGGLVGVGIAGCGVVAVTIGAGRVGVATWWHAQLTTHPGLLQAAFGMLPSAAQFLLLSIDEHSTLFHFTPSRCLGWKCFPA